MSRYGLTAMTYSRRMAIAERTKDIQEMTIGSDLLVVYNEGNWAFSVKVLKCHPWEISKAINYPESLDGSRWLDSVTVQASRRGCSKQLGMQIN